MKILPFHVLLHASEKKLLQMCTRIHIRILALFAIAKQNKTNVRLSNDEIYFGKNHIVELNKSENQSE